MLVATNDANNVRLAAMTGGATVALNAASYALAAALAWSAACSACAAVAFIQGTYCAAAAAMAAEGGPRHGPLGRPESADPKSPAGENPSGARLSHDAASAIIGPEPGPVYISPELTSGGNVAKSIANPLIRQQPRWRPRWWHTSRRRPPTSSRTSGESPRLARSPLGKRVHAR